jgi:putative endonuclease
MKRGGYVYIMTNQRHTVFYTGVTASLYRRVQEHKEKRDPHSFTARYNCDKLIYFNGFQHIEEAITEEKRIKGLRREKKLKLIEAINPNWNDLSLADIED